MKHHPSWTALRSYAITAGLACLMGVSYELFVFPNAFAPAGINGLATMLQYLLHVNIGYLSLLINLPLVLLAWKKVDRDFARKTLVFVLVFSAVTLVLGQMDLSAIAYDSGSSAILGPVAAGVVSGAVYGWVIRQNGSTGGTDIIAMVVKKYFKCHIGKALLVVDFFITVMTFVAFGPTTGLFSILGLVMRSFAVDFFLEEMNTYKSFTIITDHAEEIYQYITQVLHRGATIYHAEGVFEHSDKTIILTAQSKQQGIKLQEQIKKADPHAFVLISNTSEIIGKGFRGGN